MHLLLLFVLSSLRFLLSCSTFAQASHFNPHPHLNNATDWQSLLAFKASIMSDPNDVLGNWDSNVTFCNWRGIWCSSRRERVVVINLQSKGLRGTITAFLKNLSFLHTLRLGNNSFYGPIPHELGSLRRLRTLSLPINELEGPIPTALANCSKLEILALSFNQLSGIIPPELSLLTGLRILYLDQSNLKGTIPPSLGNLSALVELDLGVNNLQGVIPPRLGLLINLQSLSISENHLSGHIPPSLSNCTALFELGLYDNHLTGTIPVELGARLLNLQVLSLWKNQLSGSIPESVGNCTQLTKLALNENQLTGAVPVALGKLHLLERLYLHNNRLVSGDGLPVLTALANCSVLQEIHLNSNNLTGVLPPSIGRLSTNLSVLRLQINRIGGNIPPQIGNLKSLYHLDLSSNLFNGALPPALKGLVNLQRLHLDNNRLQGSIPREIGYLSNLGELYLGNNRISGQIPSSVGDLQQLRYLDLHQNQLTGRIPETLGNCWRMELLDLSYNRFSEDIPPNVAGLPNLLKYFNLSSNSLRGSLPLEIGQMAKVLAIDISMNRLDGAIPGTLGGCSALQYLNLSHNTLEGGMSPDSFGQLRSLQDMDLSFNGLSGRIPESLETLNMLAHLNLSFNNLSGEIPRAAVFTNLTSASFIGNPGLCGSWIHLPACLASASGKHTDSAHALLKRIIASVAAVGGLILFILLVGFFRSRNWYLKHLDLSKGFTPKRGPPRISYQDLLTATNGFDEANLLGVGSFGSVYKAILRDGTTAAIKVFPFQNEESDKSFRRECRVLRRIRHRNLVRIITSFSDEHLKCLVFQFMPNGSLEKCLYAAADDNTVDTEACGLSLSDRLNVAIDVARGMTYLHHDCFEQVVHCDLKPTNVLLDESMTARVTDFGIAKLIYPNSSDSLTSTQALRGSIGYIAPGGPLICIICECVLELEKPKSDCVNWNAEYGLNGRVSTKGDVYSYGILLLEMLTRKKPTDAMFAEGDLNLHKWVALAYPDRIPDVVDRSLLEGFNTERQEIVRCCLLRLVHVGLLSSKESPEDRPSMRAVVGALESIKQSFEGTTLSARFASDIWHLVANTSAAGGDLESRSSTTSTL